MLLDFVLHINHRALILLWAVIVAFIFMSYRVHYLFLILGRCIFLYYRILSCIWNSLNQKCFLRNKKMRWRGMKLGVFMGLCRLTFSSRSSSTWITIDMACIDTIMTKIFSVQPVYAYMIDRKTLPQRQFPYQRSLASHKQSTGAAYIHNSYRKSSALPAMLRANTS